MRMLRFVGGLILGSLLGAGVGILMAPRSGPDTRKRLQEQVELVLAEGRQAAETKRLELSAQLEARKQPLR